MPVFSIDVQLTGNFITFIVVASRKQKKRYIMHLIRKSRNICVAI